MPRYYFHLFNDGELRDETGQSFDGLIDARRAAVRGVSELIAESIAAGHRVDLDHRIDIEDSQGNVTSRVMFGDLFVYRGQPLRLSADEPRKSGIQP
jgi:hypothetical protein